MSVYRIFGSELSPYSVKVRSYFRYKGLPHEWLLRSPANAAAINMPEDDADAPAPSWLLRARWIFLAAVPSGLSIGADASNCSMIGVESWRPTPSGVTTSGTSGSLAYFWNSA